MRGRPFVKGKSGNPGGRPHVIAELRDLARRHAPDAIKELGRLALKARSSRPALPPSVSCLIAVTKRAPRYRFGRLWLEARSRGLSSKCRASVQTFLFEESRS